MTLSFYKTFEKAKKAFSHLAVFASIISFLGFLFYYGFELSTNQIFLLEKVFSILIIIFVCSFSLNFIHANIQGRRIPKAFNIVIGIVALITFLMLFEIDKQLSFMSPLCFLRHEIMIRQALCIFFAIHTFSTLEFKIKSSLLNPAQVFVVSFIIIVFLGTLLLLLPKATHSGISILDAFFTATSAVCVTGLVVVDTASHFTFLGKAIILFLIQIGGLGIMTFTVFFANYFKGYASYSSHLMIKGITRNNKLAEGIDTLKQILAITLSIELIGFIFIYLSTSNAFFDASTHLNFSIFHTISAFCNAGFTNIENGLLNNNVLNNFWLYNIISFLIVLGGLGFPILFTLVKTIKYYLQKITATLTNSNFYEHNPRVIDFNSRIVLITSFILFFSATLLFLCFEWNQTLVEYNLFEKVSLSFFNAVTPRTAGFNVVDLSELSIASIMIIFLLMWIGASPASTGGGIKTTTFAIASLNILSVAAAKSKIELFRRKISTNSIQRAFATISLSLIMIGLGVFVMSIYQPQMSFKAIAFECFSAYSTVGLSLGITSKLNMVSKLVLIILMFTGRVSMLTLVDAMIKDAKNINYKYPNEDILIS